MSTHQRFGIARRDYGDCILFVLKSLGGVAHMDEVLGGVYRMVEPFLTRRDYETTNTSNEVNWRNIARWEKAALVRGGALLPPQLSGQGIWALSTLGRSLAPGEPPSGLGNPGHGAQGRVLATTRPAVRGPASPVSADHLGSLARTMYEASSAPEGPDANPAMGMVIATLESLLSVNRPRGQASHGKKASKRRGSTAQGASHRIHHGVSGLTSSSMAGALDTARLTEFIEGRWAEAIKSWRDADDGSAKYVREVEALAALPILGSLLAYRKGWIQRVEATRITIRAAHVALNYPRRLGGTVGKLLEKGLTGSRASSLEHGILHHALTSWVRALDEEQIPSTLLFSIALRAWVDDIRRGVGDPVAWPQRREWAWLLEESPFLPAPSDREDEVLGMDAWLARAKPTERTVRPAPGALLWNDRAGWAVLRRVRNRARAELFPIAVGDARTFGNLPSSPWLDVAAVVEASSDGEALAPTVSLVHEFALDCHNALYRGILFNKASRPGA